jgi:hypothetical protein
LGKLETDKKIPLHTLNMPVSIHFATEKELLEECFAGESFLSLIEDDFKDAIRSLSKKLWTIGKADENISPQIKKLMVSKKYWEV